MPNLTEPFSADSFTSSESHRQTVPAAHVGADADVFFDFPVTEQREQAPSAELHAKGAQLNSMGPHRTS